VTIKAAAVCALVILSTPAAAQGWGPYGPGGYGPVGYPEIRASLRDHGLRPISQPVLSGRYVVIRAVDRAGEPVRVLMSARYGDVIEVTRLSSGPGVSAYEPRPFRPYMLYPERRYPPLERRAARPDLMYEPEESVPPKAGPNGSDLAPTGRAAAPNAGARSAALTPNRTPTPRPRPAAAGTTAAVTPAPTARDTKPAPAATATKSAPAASAAKPSPAAAAAALSTPEAPAVTGSTPLPDGRHTFPPAATLE
jgi:hypothetical protein